jgi:hypothetical protein
MEKVSDIDYKNTDWNKFFIRHSGENTYLVEFGKEAILKKDYTYQSPNMTSYRQSYYESHKQEFKDRYKVWYERNKEEIKERRRLQYLNEEKINCECGKVFQKRNLRKHLKTKTHILFQQK